MRPSSFTCVVDDAYRLPGGCPVFSCSPIRLLTVVAATFRPTRAREEFLSLAQTGACASAAPVEASGYEQLDDLSRGVADFSPGDRKGLFGGTADVCVSIAVGRQIKAAVLLPGHRVVPCRSPERNLLVGPCAG